MNIIVFSKRWGRARQYELARPWLLTMVIGLVVTTLAVAFYAGLQFGANHGLRANGQIQNWAHTLQAQAAQVEQAKLQLQNKLDALAARVGQMNAHIIRIDALGKRITAMAKLKQGEFNFEQDPALGGPETGNDEVGVSVVAPEISAMLDTLLKQIQDRERQLGVLENLIANQNLKRQIVPDGRPVASGWVSSYFGSRSDPFTGRTAFHSGVDFAGSEGSQVVAVAAGVVTYAAERAGYGLLVEITHGNGYITRYAHNKEVLVKVGDRIERGQNISLIGSTGRSTGPHLHFEVLKNGNAINPLPFVGGQIAVPADKPVLTTAAITNNNS